MNSNTLSKKRSATKEFKIFSIRKKKDQPTPPSAILALSNHQKFTEILTRYKAGFDRFYPSQQNLQQPLHIQNHSTPATPATPAAPASPIQSESGSTLTFVTNYTAKSQHSILDNPLVSELEPILNSLSAFILNEQQKNQLDPVQNLLFILMTMAIYELICNTANVNFSAPPKFNPPHFEKLNNLYNETSNMIGNLQLGYSHILLDRVYEKVPIKSEYDDYEFKTLYFLINHSPCTPTVIREQIWMEIKAMSSHNKHPSLKLTEQNQRSLFASYNNSIKTLKPEYNVALNNLKATHSIWVSYATDLKYDRMIETKNNRMVELFNKSLLRLHYMHWHTECTKKKGIEHATKLINTHIKSHAKRFCFETLSQNRTIVIRNRRLINRHTNRHNRSTLQNTFHLWQLVNLDKQLSDNKVNNLTYRRLNQAFNRIHKYAISKKQTSRFGDYLAKTTTQKYNKHLKEMCFSRLNEYTNTARREKRRIKSWTIRHHQSTLQKTFHLWHNQLRHHASIKQTVMMTMTITHAADTFSNRTLHQSFKHLKEGIDSVQRQQDLWNKCTRALLRKERNQPRIAYTRQLDLWEKCTRALLRKERNQRMIAYTRQPDALLGIPSTKFASYREIVSNTLKALDNNVTDQRWKHTSQLVIGLGVTSLVALSYSLYKFRSNAQAEAIALPTPAVSTPTSSAVINESRDAAPDSDTPDTGFVSGLCNALFCCFFPSSGNTIRSGSITQPLLKN